MRKKLAAVLAVLALAAAMSIVPGQSALAQRGRSSAAQCHAEFLVTRDFARFFKCLMVSTGRPEIPGQ